MSAGLFAWQVISTPRARYQTAAICFHLASGHVQRTLPVICLKLSENKYKMGAMNCHHLLSSKSYSKVLLNSNRTTQHFILRIHLSRSFQKTLQNMALTSCLAALLENLVDYGLTIFVGLTILLALFDLLVGLVQLSTSGPTMWIVSTVAAVVVFKLIVETLKNRRALVINCWIFQALLALLLIASFHEDIVKQNFPSYDANTVRIAMGFLYALDIVGLGIRIGWG
jgi:hypothetical protein